MLLYRKNVSEIYYISRNYQFYVFRCPVDNKSKSFTNNLYVDFNKSEYSYCKN